ncbi:MAG: hypothetical protein P4L39_10135 [Humidesulfovibrio sp.]|nr:hypothetical protein [Humidesulfovibrio sp.]
MVDAKDLTALSPRLRNAVLTELAQPMPRGRGLLAYREPLRFLDQDQVDTGEGPGPHIVFFGYYPYATVIKRAIALKAAAPRAHLSFIGCCIREDTEILRWFDQAYEVADYHELFSLFQALKVHALQITVPPFWPGLLAVCGATGTRLVVDLVDTALFHSTGDPLLREMERAVLSQAFSIIHKLPEEGIARLREAYALDQPVHQLHSLPWGEIFAEQRPKDQSRPEVLYCGGVMPRKSALRAGYGHHIFDPLIQATADSGLRLSFFVNQNAREMYWEEHAEYLDLAEGLEHFSFRRGVPFHELPRTIAGAHFGLLYDNLELTRILPEAFRYNMSSKIFSYMEAGLPLLAYSRFDYICELIEEHGFGLVYDVSQPQDLARIIADADYPALQANVDRFRREHELTGAGMAEQLRAFGLTSEAVSPR